MATPANVVLNDGTNDHTFKPVSVGNGRAVLVAREGVSSVGDPRMILDFSEAYSGRKTDKFAFRVNQPLEVTIDGVTTVKSTPLFAGNVVLPDDMTAAERDVFTAMCKALVAHAVWLAYSKDRDPFV